jgi:hypothetical protein
MYCIAKARAVCAICGHRKYSREDKADLQTVCTRRNLNYDDGMNRIQLLGLLQADDIAAGGLPNPGSPSAYEVTDEQLSQLQIGLNWSMIKHIRERASANWSTCEELRFQFGVAVTLVHELAHAFWAYVQRRCWSCFEQEPWVSKDEKKQALEEEAELGWSWEYFAFGSRAPTGRRIRQRGDKGVPNEFQQCQWNYTGATLEAGRGKHPVVEHDFVLPVQYIHSWFQESTWQNIATNGRLAGRPNFHNALVMRHVPQSINDDESWGNRSCSMERYTYQQLVAHKGLAKGPRKWIYGKDFATKEKTDEYVDKLRRLRERRMLAERDRLKRTERRRKEAEEGPKVKHRWVTCENGQRKQKLVCVINRPP